MIRGVIENISPYHCKAIIMQHDPLSTLTGCCELLINIVIDIFMKVFKSPEEIQTSGFGDREGTEGPGP